MKKLPEEFLNCAQEFAGEEYHAFIASLSEPPPVSVRLNPFKQTEKFSTENNIPWSSEGRYLDERPSFTLDPLFHAGCYYVQDANSQFLEQPFLHAKKTLGRPLKVLDLCAAPGGKSTHILSLLGDDDLLIANEVVSSRNNILRENIMKWGRANVIVTQNDPADFSRLDGFFDIVVVDAPCSGEGLFRKQEDAVDEWSLQNVNRCSLRQKEILDHAFNALAPGGFLVYSTCTFEEVENDAQAKILCDDLGMELTPINDNFEGIMRTRLGLVFFPHRSRGEGFYISLLRKRGERNFTAKKSNTKSGRPVHKFIGQYVVDADRFSAVVKEERLFAIPLKHSQTFQLINENLYVRLAGIYMGELKGEDFLPSAALALSTDIKNNVPKQEVSREDAIRFLRGESMKPQGEKGWKIISHQNFNLGWIKDLGDRTNNYYPKEWRIRIVN